LFATVKKAPQPDDAKGYRPIENISASILKVPCCVALLSASFLASALSSTAATVLIANDAGGPVGATCKDTRPFAIPGRTSLATLATVIGDSPRRFRLGAVPDVLPGAPERPSRKVAVQKLDALTLPRNSGAMSARNTFE